MSFSSGSTSTNLLVDREADRAILIDFDNGRLPCVTLDCQVPRNFYAAHPQKKA